MTGPSSCAENSIRFDNITIHPFKNTMWTYTIVKYPFNDIVNMGIFSDKDIVEGMMTGYLGISDYSERGLTPNGYDLRIAEISIRGDENKYTEGTVTIPPRTMFYVSTIERVRMPADACAQLWLRTTWIRKGIMGAFGKIDAGFEGTLTLGAYNATDDPVELPIGERFCQMVFEGLNSCSVKDYAERSGNYQGQTGITLEPVKK